MTDPAITARRRQSLLDKLGDGLLILPTGQELLRNSDVHHDFRPGSDFEYLTGFPEPDAVLVAWREGRGRHRSVLFVRPRDKAQEIWNGRRLGVSGAIRRHGVDEAHSIAELWKKVATLLDGHERVFHTLGRDGRFDESLMEVLRKRAHDRRRSNPPAHPVFEDPTPAIGQLRLIKSREEIEIMERSAEISVAGHLRAMCVARPGMSELEVQAELEAEFRRGGSRRNGYPSIVASGPNAGILHYTDNDRRMRRGDLLLVDAGAEMLGYTADITRTFPVDGTFTPAQAAIYRVVLAAEKAGIRSVKPGSSWNSPHTTCLRVITRGLVKLGVLRGSVPDLVKDGACRKWFMHGTSHWLGRDVHDVGSYEDEKGRPTRFRPGMVLTVEPGLYFDARDMSIPKEFRGIGIRIEDDVLVTRSGHRVLTAAAPKELRDIEAACRG